MNDRAPAHRDRNRRALLKQSPCQSERRYFHNEAGISPNKNTVLAHGLDVEDGWKIKIGRR
jgi:hypothetical protein